MKRVRSTLLLLLLAAGTTAPVLADEDGAFFDGKVRLGFRAVSIDGADSKFKEDYNLDDGPRLFDLSFDFAPAGSMRGAVDRVHLDLSNLGGDPFETMDLRVDKFGAYKFKYQRSKSDYFYHDQFLPPELVNFRLSNGGDFHTFDFERVRENADLTVTVSPRAKFVFGFDRTTKIGESTTTLDISRDEFEFDKPIHESLNDYRAGFEYSWGKATLTLEERVRDYENVVDLFLPGASEGENPAPVSASLAFFFLDQPYDYTSYDHTARLVYRPNAKLTLRGALTIQDLSLDVEASERSAGTDFADRPVTTNASGEGEIERDLALFDFDLSYAINTRLSVVGGLRRKTLDQEGEFTFGGSRNAGTWEVENTTGEVGLQVAISPQLTVSGGVRLESRDVEFGQEEALDPGESLAVEDEDTEHTGVYALVGWQPSKRLRLTLDVENSSYDDPLTVALPTDRQRIRLAGRFNLDNGFWLNGSFVANDYENGDSDWDASTDQVSLRVGYQTKVLAVSAGYNLVSIDRAIDQLVLGRVLAIDYEADADFVDASLSWKAQEAWSLGGDARLYQNDGSFGLERTDLRGWVEHTFKQGYALRAGYRTIDYDEDRFDFDDYDADVLELSLGYRW